MSAEKQYVEPWIGFDLDKTLAFYDEWRGETHIGEPIAPMVDLVKSLLQEGEKVKIFTARISHCGPECVKAIEDWCLVHIGEKLEVTNVKDIGMTFLYDDRAKQVVPNKGVLVESMLEALDMIYTDALVIFMFLAFSVCYFSRPILIRLVDYLTNCRRVLNEGD